MHGRTVMFAGLCLAITWAMLTTAPVAKGQAGTANQDWVQRDAVEVLPRTQGLEVVVPVDNPLSITARKRLDVAITDLSGTPWTQGSRLFRLDPGTNKCTLLLRGDFPEERIPESVLRYTLSGLGRSEDGARSLLHSMAQLETRLVSYRNFLTGSRAGVRLVARNHATGAPVEGARVDIGLVTDTTRHDVYSGTTGPNGTLDAQFMTPENLTGPADLDIYIAAKGLGEDHLTQPVTLERKVKILLTTDKPLYQPGQVIEIRALSLGTGDLKPEADKPLVFEVMDSKGNKVFKRTVANDAFGVAATQFQLASEVNLGPYIVRAVLGETTVEKQVNVDRYVLPKFKIALTSDRAYYLPGETVKGEVQADYFFGKPVAGGKVKVVASKFVINFEEFAEMEGTLDDSGHWSFEIPLPRYFAGTPIEQGQASVRLVAEVIDTADHREEQVAMKPVAGAPLEVFAVPESGSLVPELENRVYLLVSYPDGTPASDAHVLVNGSGVDTATADQRTDELGIATIKMTPNRSGEISLAVRARDRQGRNVEKKIGLTTKPTGENLILRTDKALYQVGDTIHGEVLATRESGAVYFDLVREGQTVMTRSADLDNGRAAVTLDVDPAMSGSVALQAYVFTPTTDLVRDTRLLYVNPADALQIAVALDRETYRPGEGAVMTFNVTDRKGDPITAALGITVVDESVYALQEIHPGLEKVYFTLEQEIMKPRYEIHGYELQELVKLPAPVREEAFPALWSDTQQKAARVLLASAPAVPDPPVRLNSFDQKSRAADEAILKAYQEDLEHIHRAILRYMERHSGKAPSDILNILLREKSLRPADLVDPWGNDYEFDLSHVQEWGGFFTMLSCGPDGIKGTADDVAPDSPWVNQRRQLVRGGFGGIAAGVRQMFFDAEGDRFLAMPEAAAAMPMVVMEKGAADQLNALGYVSSEPTSGEAAPAVRIREYFPETLLFEPALITDAKGLASLNVDMADTITTWRMTTMASSRGGALGSTETPLRVFQDFFVDLDLPVALTQNDRISIPVVAYNYLDQPQDVRLKFEEAPWFTLDGGSEQTLRLEPNEVRSVYFPMEVNELGKHQLTVFAYGTKMNDAIRREIEVLPDGELKEVTVSDRLSGPVEHTITIPGDAIEGASKILVRVYPGVFSQVVDGLDSMLQMPSGCFEQTSASTYPNILIVDYMKETEQINPELQMKAEGFINAGYQRLLAYEVAGGGYSWFGDAPANQILTAWGLKEFADMSEVFEVDPAVLERTRAWLLGKQEADGSWKPDENYLHAESWGNIQQSRVLVTAYIADAVVNGGGSPSDIQRAIDYLRANWDKTEDAYALSIVANAFVSWNKNDPTTGQVLARLYEMRDEDKETAHWKGSTETVTFTHGDAAAVETTALSATAFLKAGKYPETVTKALTYLIRAKSASGHWGSTQATILALKALLLSLGSQTEQVDATVKVALNGEPVSDLRITPEDSDVMRLVDLGDRTQAGANAVSLTFAGEGSMLYQVAGRYYAPWTGRARPGEPMSIEVAYDKTELEVNDEVRATVTIRNNRPGAAQMTVVDLGIPPGFQVTAADLELLVQQEIIEKYELTGRQIILYFERVDGNGVVTLSYTLRAKYPLRAQTPKSRVYEYYNPEVSGTATPVALVVQ